MVNIQTVRKVNEEHYRKRPLVAVFIGGTKGIGRYAVEVLADLYAEQKDTSLRIYIVGRQKASANSVLEYCRERCPQGQFSFVQAKDIALLSGVDRASAKILSLEQEQHGNEIPRIDLLVQTQAEIIFGPRVDTEEGLDRSMSLLYYSRIRFITQLMPLLQRSTHGARIVSICAAGSEGTLYRDDLSLRDPNHYSYMIVRSHVCYMKTMTFERLAALHPELVFVHMFPGMVFGPSYYDSSLPWWFKTFRTLLEPLVRWTYATPPEDAGPRTLFLATSGFASRTSGHAIAELATGTDGSVGSGCYAVGAQCDILTGRKYTATYPKLRDEGFQHEVWKHTETALETIAAGQVFKN